MGTINGTSMAMRVLLFTTVMALNFSELAGLTILSSSTVSVVSVRFLAETDDLSSTSRHLDGTVRRDPLDHLKKYRGGYDITNKHYWSSTAFTGIPGYAMAVLWLLCGLGYGGFLLAKTTCASSRKLKKRSSCHKHCHLQTVVLAILFTLLAITACGLVLGGNAKFHSRAKTVIGIIIDTADEASVTVYNTTGAMKDMSSTLGEGENDRATDLLDSASQRLNTQASSIQRQASKNRRLINKGLNIVYIVTTVTISTTLILVIALLVFGLLKFQRTLKVLIVICWLLTVLCWLFYGVYFFIHNFAGDTCTALEGFQQDPYNNSLSSILPCQELLSAKSVLNDISAGIHDLVKEVNKNISRSYGSIFQICNPFSPPPMYEYQPWDCPPTSIRIADIPQVLRSLTCPDSEGRTCNGGILVPASYYDNVEAYCTSVQKLLDAYPGMESLVECQTVTDAFSEILHKQCKPLKRSIHMVWGALLFLSLVMLVLVLVWLIGSYHEQNHHSLGSSVKPTSINTLESGTAKSTTNYWSSVQTPNQ